MPAEHRTEERSKIRKHIPTWIKSLFILAAAVFLFSARSHFFGNHEKETTMVDTSAKLEKVLQISELSTYQVTFNGVANVKDADGRLLYYVAYKAKVGIGIDMEKIRVSIETDETDESDESDKADETDNLHKKIIVTLPDVEIADVNVDPGSLDYIFKDSSANNDHVAVTALPACKEDAEAECRANPVLFELAEENAQNTIEALMRPFLVQNEDYQLEVRGKGE